MRWLVCMSADIYCQITNNHFYATPMFLYSKGKKGKRTSCRRDRERQRVCKRWRVAKNRVSIHHKTVIGRRISYFEISGSSNVRIMFSWETILMGKKDYERYIKIKIMSENASRYLALRHLIHFPYFSWIFS
jgi:hypothetical protein